MSSQSDKRFVNTVKEIISFYAEHRRLPSSSDHVKWHAFIIRQRAIAQKSMQQHWQTKLIKELTLTNWFYTAEFSDDWVHQYIKNKHKSLKKNKSIRAKAAKTSANAIPTKGAVALRHEERRNAVLKKMLLNLGTVHNAFYFCTVALNIKKTQFYKTVGVHRQDPRFFKKPSPMLVWRLVALSDGAIQKTDLLPEFASASFPPVIFERFHLRDL